MADGENGEIYPGALPLGMHVGDNRREFVVPNDGTARLDWPPVNHAVQLGEMDTGTGVISGFVELCTVDDDDEEEPFSRSLNVYTAEFTIDPKLSTGKVQPEPASELSKVVYPPDVSIEQVIADAAGSLLRRKQQQVEEAEERITDNNRIIKRMFSFFVGMGLFGSGLICLSFFLDKDTNLPEQSVAYGQISTVAAGGFLYGMVIKTLRRGELKAQKSSLEVEADKLGSVVKAIGKHGITFLKDETNEADPESE